MVKVKAHLDVEDVIKGVTTFRDLAGNSEADRWAKKGAAMAQSSSPTGVVERCYWQAVRWYRWVVRFAAQWTDFQFDPGGEDRDAEPHQEEEAMPIREDVNDALAEADAVPSVPLHRRPVRLHRVSPHLLWSDHRRTVCRRCGRASSARTAAARNRFAATQCLGAAAGRALYRLGLDTLALDVRCRIGQCAMIGMGLQPLDETAGLLPEHCGDVADAQGGYDEACRGSGRDGVDDDVSRSSGRLLPPEVEQPGNGDADEVLVALPRQREEDHSRLDEPPLVRRRLDPPSPGPVRTRNLEAMVGQKPDQRRVRQRTGVELRGAVHRVKVVGPIAFCDLCGRYAIERHGVGLGDDCMGLDLNARVRIERMRSGRHPLTGVSLVNR